MQFQAFRNEKLFYNVQFEQDDSKKKHNKMDCKKYIFCMFSTTHPTPQEKRKAVTWIGVPERIIL